jgi:DNA repair exonuclease SbcCD ATPase subunit
VGDGLRQDEREARWELLEDVDSINTDLVDLLTGRLLEARAEIAQLRESAEHWKRYGERADDERCELREALDEARAMARMLLTGLCPVCNEPLSSVGFLRGTWRSFNTLRCSCGYTATRADLLAKLGDEGAST